MQGKKKLMSLGFGICLIIFIFSFSFSFAAQQLTRIEGNIYDPFLTPLNKVVVRINSSPPQTYVVNNYSYFFFVPEGNYRIEILIPTSQGLVQIYNETIEIKQTGTFYYDIILPLEVDEDILLGNFSEEDISIIEENKINWPLIILFLIVALFTILVVFLVIKKTRKILSRLEGMKKSLEEEQVVEILKRNGYRMRQKDLLKQLDMSKSKLSLLLTELEEKGIIKKYKKGRGNVIVLIKK